MSEVDKNKDNAQMNEDQNDESRAEFQKRVEDFEKIENPVKMRKRYERYERFNKFHETVKEQFTSLRDNDERGKLYEAFNKLCICPGSRMGGTRRDIVEVFWGAKIYDSAYKPKIKNRFKALVENGATLTFLQKDDGYVSVYLSPASTDKNNEYDEVIILYRSLDPKWLHNRCFIKRLWKYFMAYTEYTHLDGSPSLCQRILINWLRFVKCTLRNGLFTLPRILMALYELVKWIMTVALSGCLLTFIQMWREDKNSDSQTITNIEQAVDSIKTINSSQTIQLNDINSQIDSIRVLMKDIKDNTGKPIQIKCTK